MSLAIPSFANSRILVAGDIMLDRYWHGETSRISPEAPVPVVRVAEQQERPGGAANVALNITALGARACLLGVTGDDNAADLLQEQLCRHQVECVFQRRPERPTITKLRILSRHQQLIRLDFEDPAPPPDSEFLHGRMEQLVRDNDVVVLSDYAKGTLYDAQTFVRAARNAGKPVLVDPKGRDFSKYRGATLLTPNCSEFEQVVGHCAGQKELEDKGEKLRAELALDALLITRSERGMSLLRKDHPPLHLPAHAREVYDVTGAGDTVIGVLAAALAAGGDMVNAVALANLAAGLVVGKLGAALVTLPELEYALHTQSGRGVHTEDALCAVVQAAQAAGRRVVMTNGCFDVLHAGHVHYLNQARQLGDCLVVAVNDDASVARLKGPRRPINALEHRMAVLSALECVDWVVPFTEDTPERLICRVLPDILVKGGDYQVTQIAGHRCVLDKGGQVLVLDFLEGHSSSRIIQSL